MESLFKSLCFIYFAIVLRFSENKGENEERPFFRGNISILQHIFFENWDCRIINHDDYNVQCLRKMIALTILRVD